MTHEAGIWIFGIITLVCLSVWLLCRRSRDVEDARPLFHPFHYGCLSELIEPKICSYATPKDVGEPETTKPLPKGWQGWEGGFNPLWFIYKSEDESVVVMQRNGYITPPMIASDLRWFHEGNDRDIVAWRVA